MENEFLLQKKHHIAEVIGPAGAGKTSLCRELQRIGGNKLLIHNFPAVRDIKALPFFIWYGFGVIPALMLYKKQSRPLSRQEFAWLAILNGWPKILQKEIKTVQHNILLDQGPVYLLTETREFGPPYLKNRDASGFWRGLYRRWTATLDMIVWLDAPNECLLKRIRNRQKDHIVKDEPVQVVLDFLERYRTAYDRVVAELTINSSGPKVLRFDTSQKSPDEIARQLVIELD